ncbi:2-oxoglutarate dehydrogenase E1 component [Aneurinibacillus sp. BA2021]|nr:2-oxoglutarate dehydrogenase E1 component [Aneurinibacillus sp. BA2021]
MGSNTPWQNFEGPNLGYVHQLYEQYLQDASSVDPDIRALFDEWGAPPLYNGEAPEAMGTVQGMDAATLMQKAIAAAKLADDIRVNGHLCSKINSFVDDKDVDTQMLDPKTYGLSEEDLRQMPAKIVWADAPGHLRTGLDVIKHLREAYTSSTAYQFMHINDLEERNWLNNMVESGELKQTLSNEDQITILRKLMEVSEFEQFLHRTFAGQKRFSVEGLEMLIPMMDELIRQSARDGIRHVLIGMAHRGRLSVLAHILGKPFEKIFSEFHHSPNRELVPSEGSIGMNYGWTGDVKYHLGADREMKADDAPNMRLTLANNPSHLEFVNPVVAGYTRAAQEERHEPGPPKQDVTRAFRIAIHGDAAFPGEGIVAETLNLSRLRGYRTGGTIHIIANNQIGFTTESQDSRSTRYASDLAKGFEIPIVHVNADDPLACIQAVRLAFAYRKKFKKDFLIDLIGYRLYGHNETDDPAATQPLFYNKIVAHKRVSHLYADILQQNNVIDDNAVQEMKNVIHDKLKQAYERAKDGGEQRNLSANLQLEDALPDTRVPAETLAELNTALLQWPEKLTVYPKLARILKRRMEAFEKGIDWALAETLAFATILMDGIPIRITGQDTERGTFAHRHAVLHDVETGEQFIPLQNFPQARASFAIYNSALSEAAVLGFEYGYDVLAKDTLVLWEAQFGDFANAAQVIIDTFLAAGRAKWEQSSNLVLLLPHGYEGQGPEHSSARLERFLQLSAEKNWTVANLSSAAQYFHMLRWQASRLGKGTTRPLVIMTPKSLLRNPRASSSLAALSEGSFMRIIEQPGLEDHTATAERLILCSGKVSIDLEAEWEAKGVNDKRIHIVRVEQLYPFPKKEVADVINRCEKLQEIVWLQEEPKNMGAWGYVEPILRDITKIPIRYAGRPRHSSPAEGSPDMHKMEQQRILNEALLFTESTTVKAGGHTYE